MGFSRQEYWRGLPYLPQWGLSNPAAEPMSPVSPALQVYCLNAEPLGEPNVYVYMCVCVCVYTHTYKTKFHRHRGKSYKTIHVVY